MLWQKVLILSLFCIKSWGFEPQVDRNFIQRSLNKTVSFDPKKAEGSALPNCVATVLRAGGFLPVFAGSSTTQFYENILPKCFTPVESPSRGDVGVLVYNKKEGSELAHAVLFLDGEKVFEKPSPNYEDKFRINSWKQIKKKTQTPTLVYQVYRFKESPLCPFPEFDSFYKGLPAGSAIKKLEVLFEKRIEKSNWKRLTGEERDLLKRGQLEGDTFAITSYQKDVVRDLVSMVRGLKPHFHPRPVTGSVSEKEK